MMHMTFRKSIILSFALHLVLFGGGLAFARYSGLLSWGQSEPIMVTLVGNGGISPQARDRLKKQDRSSKTTERESSRLKPEMPSDMTPTAPAAPVEHASLSGDSQTGGPDSELAAGSPSAFVTSEQWAVIVSSIERVKNYPRLARERGIQGVVRLRFKVRERGEVERVEIVTSSGHDVLDTASIRTLYRATPMPYVSGWVEVPISYVLK